MRERINQIRIFSGLIWNFVGKFGSLKNQKNTKLYRCERLQNNLKRRM